MVTRELSSSLRKLKFMQRAIQREEMMKKQGEEEVKIDVGVGGFIFTSAVASQLSNCVIVIEGDPKPAAIRGRMSFKGFNPLIEKLNEASANPNGDHQRKHSETQNLNNLGKTNYSSPYKGLSFNNQNQASANPNGYHKRKQIEEVCDVYPNKWQKTNQGYRQPSRNKNRDSFDNRNRASADPNGYYKRKEFEEVCATQYPNKWHKTNEGYRHPSLNTNKGSFKKPEDRNCWNRPFLGVEEFNQKRWIITR